MSDHMYVCNALDTTVPPVICSFSLRLIAQLINLNHIATNNCLFLVHCRPDCVVHLCCGVEMGADLVGYTHKNKVQAVIYGCQVCGKQCSTLRRFDQEKDKRFKCLEPPADQPSVWYEHWFDQSRSKRESQWQLNCRGRIWSRCQYCRAIFLQANGKNGDHSNQRCPVWREHSKKKNPDGMLADQIPTRKRLAMTPATNIFRGMAKRSTAAIINAESGTEYNSTGGPREYGKNDNHSKQKCSVWREYSKKINPDWMHKDQITARTRPAMTPATDIFGGMAEQSTAATINNTYNNSAEGPREYGKNGNHSKQRCLGWREHSNKRKRGWQHQDQITARTRPAMTPATNIFGGMADRSTAATINTEYNSTEGPREGLVDTSSDAFVEEPYEVLSDYDDDDFVERLCDTLLEDVSIEGVELFL